jgi:hypothetical protein
MLAMKSVHQRRWFRFLLRTLLIVVTAAAVTCGVAWPILDRLLWPSPWYQGEGIQYFPPGPEFHLGRDTLQPQQP